MDADQDTGSRILPPYCMARRSEENLGTLRPFLPALAVYDTGSQYIRENIRIARQHNDPCPHTRRNGTDLHSKSH